MKLEKEIEKEYGMKVKRLGGEFLKFVSPNNAGVPDRIAIYPNGRIEFIEFKKKGGRLSALQKWWGRRLAALGCTYKVIGEDGTSNEKD